jgi:hypothetical protein
MKDWTEACYVSVSAGRGATAADDPEFSAVFAALPVPSVVIVGACVGGDMRAAITATNAGHWVHAVVPANRSQVDPAWREWCHSYEEMPSGTDYRARNERILDHGEELEAWPEYAEQHPQSRRSGTWMTIRIAKRRGMRLGVHVLRAERWD